MAPVTPQKYPQFPQAPLGTPGTLIPIKKETVMQARLIIVGGRGDFMITTPQVPQVQSVSAIPYPDLYKHQGHNTIS